MSNKKKTRAKELEEMKVLLLQEKNSTVEQIEALSRDNFSEIEDIHGDSVDIASAESAQAQRTKRALRLKNKLIKIDYALDKFAQGNYGICEHSGEEIPIARLRIRPFTQYTVEAKQELERMERKFAKANDTSSMDIEGDSEEDS